MLRAACTVPQADPSRLVNVASIKGADGSDHGLPEGLGYVVRDHRAGFISFSLYNGELSAGLSVMEGDNGVVGAGMAPLLRQAFFDAVAGSRELLTGFTRRRVTGRVSFEGKATAVVGTRRAGKTTFMHQLRADRAAAGTPLGCLPMLSLEDERFVGIDAARLGRLVDEYEDRQMAAGLGNYPMVWFLDEIQVVAGWERLVRRLLDTRNVEVFVSGSSAALLSGEIATSLRGRGWRVLIHPLGFDEALRHRGVVPHPEPRLWSRPERVRIETLFAEWLADGGFPEAQNLDTGTRRRLLSDYVDVAILRDVVDRHRVSNVAGLRWLVRHLLGNAGSLFSVEKFHRALRSQGIAIARDTVHQHLAYLQDCFLVRTVWMESRSERQRMVNPRKAYPVDTGLIPVFDRTGRANIGHALETAVLVELERRRCETTYVRTPDGYEVDFLARSDDDTTELIQVCADASTDTTATRELRALTAAGTMFPSATKRLLTLDRRGLPARAPADLTVQPTYEWILTPPSKAPNAT